MNQWRKGLRDGIPIALGYFTVAIAFGLHCVAGGFGAEVALALSATNLSSSGQFAGLAVILSTGSLLQLAVTTAIVNLRYVLMSLSLSQRLTSGMPLWQRLVVAFGVTDEIYAVAMARTRVGFAYYLGLMSLPMLGWSAGSVAGAVAGGALPPSLRSAMGVLLYAMFVAIVVPPARKALPVLCVVAVAAVASTLMSVLPVVRDLEVGWRIIVSALLAAGVGASAFPWSPKERT